MFSRRDKFKEESYIQVISLIRVIRIAQVYRMIRHLPDLQILVETMKASVAELKLWLCSFILISIIFATLIYYAEREEMNLSRQSHNLTFSSHSSAESLTIRPTTLPASLTPSGGRW